MSKYEYWSLVFTALGHALVAASILYAALQWRVAQRAQLRDVVKDTRRYMLEIDEIINGYSNDIRRMNITQESVRLSEEHPLIIRQLLNTIESITHEIDEGFYARDILVNYASSYAIEAFMNWETFISDTRHNLGKSNAWAGIERLATTRNTIV